MFRAYRTFLIGIFVFRTFLVAPKKSLIWFIKSIPDWIGNLRDLVHLEASVNHIDFVSDRISNCKLVQELALCTNDLRSLPEAIGGLESLVTLKIDDNQVLFLADTFSVC